MEKSRMPLAAKVLAFMQLFLGLGGLYGGVAFVIDPSGKLIGMPIRYLANSPFSNFLIPGVILLVVLGVGPVLISVVLVTRRRWRIFESLNPYKDVYWGWTYSLYIGFALVIWIVIEAYFIGVMATIHIAYALYGLAIQAVTLLPAVKNLYRRDGPALNG